MSDSSGQTVIADLGYDYRQYPPVQIANIGPVLDVNDVVAGKVRAFWTRGAERDYYDVDAILRAGGRWDVADLYGIAADLRPDEISAGTLSTQRFAERLNAFEQLDPDEFAALGCSPSDLATMQARLAAAAQRLQSGPAPTKTSNRGR